jgi:Holliday junction resolvasome RuvABC endonuclease subunit
MRTHAGKSAVTNYSKQMRLIHAIEMILFVMEIRNFYLTEVPPTTSKRLATGDGRARKEDIIDVSPFAGQRGPAAEALADAWAHSLSAGDGQWFMNKEYLVVCPPKLGDN